MGTLFREGTRFMTDLNVIHVIESICSGTEIIHKNSLTGPKLAQNSIFCSFFFKTPLLKKTPRLLNSSISMNTIIPLSTQPIIKWIQVKNPSGVAKNRAISLTKTTTVLSQFNWVIRFTLMNLIQKVHYPSLWIMFQWI